MRHATNWEALDDALGGGLRPGTLTVVAGATGIGKTQLGVKFADAGRLAEQRPGVFLDLCSRGDSQNHADYARRLANWDLCEVSPNSQHDAVDCFNPSANWGDYLNVFQGAGQRPTREGMDISQWHDWQAKLARVLTQTAGFLYGSFVRGAKRVVIDGIEPVIRPADSVQFELFEYAYHRIVRKEPEWAARELFRERYLSLADKVASNIYDPNEISCVVLQTTKEILLEDLIAKPLEEGDLLSNANTVILMGKVRQGNEYRRGLYVQKHRGSPVSDRILYYLIQDTGFVAQD